MDGRTGLADACFVEPTRGRELDVIRHNFTDRFRRARSTSTIRELAG